MMESITARHIQKWVEDYEEEAICDGFISGDSMEKMEPLLKERLLASPKIGKFMATEYDDVEDWITQVDVEAREYWDNWEDMKFEEYEIIAQVANELGIDLLSQMKKYYFDNSGIEL